MEGKAETIVVAPGVWKEWQRLADVVANIMFGVLTYSTGDELAKWIAEMLRLEAELSAATRRVADAEAAAYGALIEWETIQEEAAR